MRIYKMTATFGKLERQSLTLEPGLNIITAPNEWGKSTWCAFLVAMFYGIDTRVKTTKTAIADKERYAPWSGSPMEGRIDLNWNGRDITIERSSRGRVPLGKFKAYETDTGLPVKELSADNCGQMLLGVEQTVFRRAGFIRHANLQVTQDEALRRRLNNLVTTGDENDAADRLAETLRELKNRCRYNRTGLLPQTENERDALEAKLAELESLETQCKNLKERIGEVKDWITQLKNHRQAMEYAAQQANARRMAEAQTVLEDGEKELRRLEAVCAELAPRDEAERNIRELKVFREQWNAILQERQMLPQEPEKPVAPAPFEGMTPEEARKMARLDGETYASARKTGIPVLLIFMGLFGLAAVVLLVYLKSYPFACVAGAGALVALLWGIRELVSMKKQRKALLKKYGNDDFGHWAGPVQGYERELKRYLAVMRNYTAVKNDVQARFGALQERRNSLCGDQEPDALLEHWSRVMESWDACYAARREALRAKSHYDVLRALVKPVEKPSEPDTLTQTEAETERLLTECTQEQQRLQNRLGQYQGRMESLGDRNALRKELTRKHKRIARLEQTYAALVLAQDTLNQAREELQRRFAPRITKRAQQLLSAMTDGRYSFVTMGVDFSLQARTTEEDTLYDALWRSDGTMDQLYLALRLAVAEELTPEAPLVLDDALVRFDDRRMKAAVDILQEMARKKQVILFTCQGREAQV